MPLCFQVAPLEKFGMLQVYVVVDVSQGINAQSRQIEKCNREECWLNCGSGIQKECIPVGVVWTVC